METSDLKIARKHMDEILEYQAVLSHMLKRKISTEQAMIDWIEKGYAQQYRKKDNKGNPA